MARNLVREIPAPLSIGHLRTTFTGRVITAEDDAYEATRAVFPGGIDRRPTVIIRPADAADVARGIALAREAGLPLAVRSGGHSPAGHGVVDGGIVLDLRDMKGLQLDLNARTAWAETGLTAGEYTAAAGAHGLATGFGDTGSVGIGGITLSGGIGFLVRRHGLTIDNLLAADVVTADGRLLRTDADTHPDLFWVIGGQMLSLVLTLIAIPVIYSVFDDLAALRLRSRIRRMAGGLAAWAVQVLLPRRAPEPSPEGVVELPAAGREEGLDDHAASGLARSPHGQAAVDDERLPGDVTRTR